MDLFYRCAHCGNLVYVINDGSVNPVCCGEPMKLLKAGETDGAAEKHVPVIGVSGNEVAVKIGEVAHPMTEEHLIQWIALSANGRIDIRKLTKDDRPEAVFTLESEGPFIVYEYCNLHGLWKSEGKKL